MSTHPAWTVARAQLRTALPMIAGYWAIMVSVYATIVTIVVTVGTADVSIWATSGGSAPKYFLSALGVMLTGVFLPVYVGNGVTRRHFALGATAYLVAVAAFYAVIMAVGYAVEHPIYSAEGLLSIQTDPYPVQSFGDGLATLVAEFFVGMAYLCSGWLIGSAFYRLGTWWGIALIPVSSLPAIVSEVGFNSLWAGYGINRGFGWQTPHLVVGVLIAAASIAAAWAVNFALIRNAPMRKVSG
ncbi:hypothetical protein [Phytohabitans rumicis]|uniref:Uncharacterized protein n=1 Tax=Phytohabitans rumicis TaxID=1076125 RepID=A0A6V8KW68_9ACTN|nr:hypothetical protein [Phytohabitans rumicis]GFJ89333.1 hypothetical protein Prum_029750 [Phytohabitans rumicis]